MDSLLSRAKQARARHRPAESAGRLPSMDEILDMPLATFASSRLGLQVIVPWWPAPLWFVGTGEEADALVREGMRRATVWTARELADVMQATADPMKLRTIALAKHLFEGDLSLSSLSSQPATEPLPSPSTHARVGKEREGWGEAGKADGERSEKGEGSGWGPRGPIAHVGRRGPRNGADAQGKRA